MFIPAIQQRHVRNIGNPGHRHDRALRGMPREDFLLQINVDMGNMSDSKQPGLPQQPQVQPVDPEVRNHAFFQFGRRPPNSFGISIMPADKKPDARLLVLTISIRVIFQQFYRISARPIKIVAFERQHDETYLFIGPRLPCCQLLVHHSKCFQRCDFVGTTVDQRIERTAGDIAMDVFDPAGPTSCRGDQHSPHRGTEQVHGHCRGHHHQLETG